MERAQELDLLGELLRLVESGASHMADSDTTIPAFVYTCAERFKDERRVLFREYPILVGHASEIPAPGDFLTHDATGIPLLIVREKDGSIRGFLNVCRHRGTKLVPEARGHARAFSCRYHAWTYELSGALSRVPRREYFPTLKDEDAGLISVPVGEHAGFLFAVPGGRGTTLDVASYLGPIAKELAEFGFANHHVHRHVTCRRHANWKLVMDAFQEGYHLRSLHRDTISRFFLESLLMTRFAPHSRAIGARKSLLKLREAPQESWNLREHTTPFYTLFPNTILVFHPDWLTVLTLSPEGPDTLHYSHRMLIPKAPETDEERAHWDKTFELIEGNVFQKEDLSIAESIQQGLAAGADEHLRLGRVEAQIKWFHDQIEESLRKSPRREKA